MLKKRLIALLSIGVVCIVGIIAILVNEGVFVDKGDKLEILGKKSYVDPGQLLYCEHGDSGIWVVYSKTGQVIITLVDNHGVRRWQSVYSSSRLLVDSSKYYTIVSQIQENDVTILNTSGEKVATWVVDGVPLLCKVARDGRNAVVYEQSISAESSSWKTFLEVSDHSGQNLFVKDLDNTEIIDILWLKDKVAMVYYKVDQSDSGQYIAIYTESGQQVYEAKVNEALNAVTASPEGRQLMWVTEKAVFRYNIKTESVYKIETSDIIGAGFLSETQLYMIQNKFSVLPSNSKVLYVESDLSGHKLSRRIYPGALIDYHLIFDTMIVTTDVGLYASVGSAGKWYIELDNSIIASAIDSKENVYVFTDDDALSWFKSQR